MPFLLYSPYSYFVIAKKDKNSMNQLFLAGTLRPLGEAPDLDGNFDTSAYLPVVGVVYGGKRSPFIIRLVEYVYIYVYVYVCLYICKGPEIFNHLPSKERQVKCI